MKNQNAHFPARQRDDAPVIGRWMAYGGRLGRGLFGAGLAGLAAMALSGWLLNSGDLLDWAVAGLAFALIWLFVLRQILHNYPHSHIGACNTITLIRAALASSLVAPLLASQPAGWPVALIGAIALALDGLDGWAARREKLVSDFGARFDMEIDAFLALILALHVVAATEVAAEGLLLGLARYVFVAAAAIWPWLSSPLPQRLRRKAICVLQLATLILLQLPVIPEDVAILLARVVAALVVWSFAVDILWLRARAT